jgi:uncharacterized protein (DUF1684 family)
MLKLSSAIAVVAVVLQASSYRAETEAFRAERAAQIGAETGWAALTDLQWIDSPGTFTIGAAAGNAMVLHAPSAPANIGTLIVTPEAVTLHAAAGVAAQVDGRAVTQTVLVADAGPDGGVKIGGLTLGLIDREHRRAIRVWDRMSPTRRAFHGLQWFPIAERWRVEARFIEHRPAPVLEIQNIVGQIVEMSNPGAAVFNVGGKEYRLEALLEGPAEEELFFMFRDGTSGKTTYGAGRYLYTPLPKNGRVTLDFNRAINPPCAFTTFATCPLPPAANRLSLAIEAGERDDSH